MGTPGQFGLARATRHSPACLTFTHCPLRSPASHCRGHITTEDTGQAWNWTAAHEALQPAHHAVLAPNSCTHLAGERLHHDALLMLHEAGPCSGERRLACAMASALRRTAMPRHAMPCPAPELSRGAAMLPWSSMAAGTLRQLALTRRTAPRTASITSSLVLRSRHTERISSILSFFEAAAPYLQGRHAGVAGDAG